MASNGKWYVDLAPDEYGEYWDSITYGPFTSEQAAQKYVHQNFSNPGGDSTDDRGTKPPPKRSPNGGPVVSPRRGPSYRRWASPERVASRWAAENPTRETGKAPPREVGSARQLKRWGISAVDVFFGEVRPRPGRPIIVQGETVQNDAGDLFFFVGVDEDGRPILAKDERELKKMSRKLLQDRRRHEVSFP